ncbi:50S ribosomal protein L23 [Candidatus Peribacteria bacterium RIFCSPLOWO2_01_FULL_51_18]|nr:MAG: 50S ribosomal protein L23 [Candidatus Peribacteria bacterium RIFCSPHIGHO2_02_FULL_51_15]OGJ65600.1 MAG: 50S ribosomal protein L23 [Candidatus Peribacteria bacterium RIFCSPLOWO2_01_FULL_51_18]
MHLSSVIIGPVVTEKSERNKALGVYTIRVGPHATKIDVKNALRKYFDVEAASVRVLRTRPKVRSGPKGEQIEKRHRSKRMIIRLTKKSKALDLTKFQTS